MAVDSGKTPLVKSLHVCVQFASLCVRVKNFSVDSVAVVGGGVAAAGLLSLGRIVPE